MIGSTPGAGCSRNVKRAFSFVQRIHICLERPVRCFRSDYPYRRKDALLRAGFESFPESSSPQEAPQSTSHVKTSQQRDCSIQKKRPAHLTESHDYVRIDKPDFLQQERQVVVHFFRGGCPVVQRSSPHDITSERRARGGGAMLEIQPTVQDSPIRHVRRRRTSVVDSTCKWSPWRRGVGAVGTRPDGMSRQTSEMTYR